MDYSYLVKLRQSHPAWRLMRADNAPLIVSFLHQAFIVPNLRSVKQTELILMLDDFLYHLRLSEGESSFPKSPHQYLDDWAHNDKGWLRKFYPMHSDEAAFDLTPGTEKAIGWLAALNQASFVGTESRLLMLFDLLKQMVTGSQTDAQLRLHELQQRKAQIEVEMQAIQRGDFEVMDETALKDRFLQFSHVARELLGDFRQVEQNFRELDQSVREKIAAWEGGKGALLETVFGEQDAISDSDQGKSFRAFWDFLMSTQSQDEFTQRLDTVFELQAIQSLQPDKTLKKIHYDWLEAGEQTQRVVSRLSQQLRRFLDNQAYLENKHLMHKIEGVLRQSIQLKPWLPSAPLSGEFAGFMTLDLPKYEIDLPMERALFTVPLVQNFAGHVEADDGQDVNVDGLFDQVFIDELALKNQIERLLQVQEQVNLPQVLHVHPLNFGVAELVGYLSIASQNDSEGRFYGVIDEAQQDLIQWQDSNGQPRQAWLPRVIYSRIQANLVQ
ncbi:DUF3375 domain-containing protein [Thiomicrorhabdus aquaedulcis]|uniref:DUF3375 domain-containing protein n=1 Tax=Thiomicrorhabdus aquaedulcis TaxID=2211106 RepID=UPI000FD761C1|nr:DUF3375 domain-containing protein [Thiomicrorhabdus aquaedulcis]